MCQKYPDKTAIIFLGEKFSFAKLKELIDRFATALDDLGIGYNDKCMIYITNCPQWLIAYFALQKIGDVQICHEGRWAKKHLDSLKNAYGKAPYLEDHLNFMEEMFSLKYEKLIDLNLEIIRYLMSHLHIDTKVILLSELKIEGRGDQLLIDICRKMGISQFLAQTAARKYVNANLFQEAGIQIKFFKPPSLVYPQLWGTFIPNLSSFDLIFNCGPKAHDILAAE